MANVVYTSGIPYWPDIISSATPELTVKAALIKTTYTADHDHDFMSTLTSHEIVDASATPTYERLTLENITQTVNDTSNVVTYDADDLVWPLLDNTDAVSGVVLYIDTGVDATSQLLVYYDIDTVTPNGTDFNVYWAATGFMNFRQA